MKLNSRIFQHINVSCFFDRYGHWTAPEYYQMAHENYQIDQQKKLKGMSLELRRERLRTLLMHEKQQYDEQLNSEYQVKLWSC